MRSTPKALKLTIFLLSIVALMSMASLVLARSWWQGLLGVAVTVLSISTLLLILSQRKTLIASEQLLQIYRDALRATPYAVAIYDEKDVLIDYNEAYRVIHKTSFEKQQTDIITYADLIRAEIDSALSAEDAETLVTARVAIQREGDGSRRDRRYPDGRWLRVSKHRTEKNAIVGYGIDITDLKHRELDLNDSERRYAALTQVAPVGIWHVSQDGKTHFSNQALLAIFSLRTAKDLEREDVLNTIRVYKGERLLTKKESYAQLLEGMDQRYVDASYCGIEEKTIYIARSELIEDNHGGHSYMLAVLDVTERKQAEREIRYLAEHDPLTGLANRSTLNTHIHTLIAKNKAFALVFLDLDHFKSVNDSLGHQIGDELLVHASTCIKSALRRGDFASRFGGDEFAVILSDENMIRYTRNLMKRLYESFKEPIIIDGQLIQVSASSGIALYPDHGESSEDLIQHADIALYHQKKMGRGSFTVFEAAFASEAQASKQIENDLRRALINGEELTVHYQPQYDIHTLEIGGVEALVRWKSARTGQWVPPVEFIPIAEQSGLIYQLDRFVLLTAAKQVHQWHQKGYNDILLSSNLSTVHFKGDFLPTMLQEVLSLSHIDPRFIELEITEGLFLEEQSSATEQLMHLRQQGIRIAVDDFGTGYSNLGYLNNLPVDTLKIDRSFISNFSNSNYHRAIVYFIIELGNNLGLDIVAEGIETVEQVKALKTLNCSRGQGYYLAKPEAPELIEELLSRQQKEHMLGGSEA